MKRPGLWPVALAVLTISVGAATLRAKPQGATGTVCGRPGEACDTSYKQFAPHELPFRLPRELKANTPFRSAPFYALIATRRAARASDCDGGETTVSVERERQRLQKLFPTRRVFADHQCPDMGAVSYEFAGAKNEVFLAVFAGSTRETAIAMLPRARQISKSARVARMTLVFERIVQ